MPRLTKSALHILTRTLNFFLKMISKVSFKLRTEIGALGTDFRSDTTDIRSRKHYERFTVPQNRIYGHPGRYTVLGLTCFFTQS